jgi:adenylate kinase family enzyme
MRKVAIVGNVAGGKSTLSRHLGKWLALPHYEMDKLGTRPDGQIVPLAEVAGAHAQVLEQPGWIIDGWGDFPIIEARLGAADTIILFDFPLWRHYWWAMKRQIKGSFVPRIDGPYGHRQNTPTLLQWIWILHRHRMPALRELVARHGAGKQVIRIRRLRDLHGVYAASNRAARPEPAG